MSFSEGVLQVLSGAAPCHFCPNPCSSSVNSKFPFKLYVKHRKQRGLWNIRSRLDYNCKRIYGVQNVRGICHGTAINRSRFLNCHCQRVESISETIGEDGNGFWFKDPTKQVNPILSEEKKEVLDFEEVQPLKNDKEVSTTTNGVMCKDTSFNSGKISVEDEAWSLLRESMVYYCGSPIGTIAALDTSSSNVLNYDQVFIRDFIPSGIAFLLKGEYDIVRNFILHTLQLQVSTYSKNFITADDIQSIEKLEEFPFVSFF